MLRGTKPRFKVQVLSPLVEPGIVQRDIVLSDTVPGEVSFSKCGEVKPHWVSDSYLRRLLSSAALQGA